MEDWVSKEAREHKKELSEECFFKDGKPSVHRSIIAFIDILGFKALIGNENASFVLEKIYSTYIKSLKEIEDSVVFLKSFSDNILIVYPEISEGSLGNNFFIQLADLQSELLKNGIIVRGAITIGDIHIGENVIFGRGLVEAYKLESEKAIVPRIILSEKVLALCKEYHKDYANDNSPFKRALLTDADGYTFINYLHNPYLGGDAYLNAVSEYLKIHRDLIKDKLKEFSSDIRIFDKYVWLGHYHNSFCELSKLDFKISGEDISRKIAQVIF